LTQLVEGYKQGKPTKISARRDSEISRLPWIDESDWNLIVKTYGPHLNNKIDVMTSRGCQYQCEFCSIRRESLGYKNRNYRSVIREIVALANHGMQIISIKDEIFPVSRDGALRVLQGVRDILGTGHALRFKIKSRVSTLEGRMDYVEKLYSLGVNEIQFGVETFDGSKHATMDKGPSASNGAMINFLQDVASIGITVNASLILGWSGETREYYKRLLGFVNELQPLDKFKIYVNFFTPHPAGGRWNLSDSWSLVNSDLNCFTHKIPVACPRSLKTKADRRAMLETYKTIVGETKSRNYNPPVSEENQAMFLDLDRDFRLTDIPIYSSAGESDAN